VLRITTITAKDSQVLKLEGKLSGPWVDELQSCWKEAVAEVAHRKPIQIDMRGVSYLDPRGRKLLQRMEHEGAALTECSNFIRRLLHASGADDKTARQTTKKTKKENEHASTVRT
jgi:anti-anti-sigma regulatory factor